MAKKRKGADVFDAKIKQGNIKRQELDLAKEIEAAARANEIQKLQNLIQNADKKDYIQVLKNLTVDLSGDIELRLSKEVLKIVKFIYENIELDIEEMLADDSPNEELQIACMLIGKGLEDLGPALLNIMESGNNVEQVLQEVYFDFQDGIGIYGQTICRLYNEGNDNEVIEKLFKHLNDDGDFHKDIFAMFILFDDEEENAAYIEVVAKNLTVEGVYNGIELWNGIESLNGEFYTVDTIHTMLEQIRKHNQDLLIALGQQQKEGEGFSVFNKCVLELIKAENKIIEKEADKALKEVMPKELVEIITGYVISEPEEPFGEVAPLIGDNEYEEYNPAIAY